MREAAVVSQPNPLQRIPGVAIVLVVLIVLFGTIAPGFLSAANLSNVLVQSTILTMLALPMTLIIMTEGLDLSMGAVLTLTSLCVAIVSLATQSMLLGHGAGPVADRLRRPERGRYSPQRPRHLLGDPARHSRADRDRARDLRRLPRPALSHPLRQLCVRTRRQSRSAPLCR